MLELIGAIVIALLVVWLLPVLLVAIFTAPMAIAAHIREWLAKHPVAKP